jgi:Tfp pilus assembly protein PilX
MFKEERVSSLRRGEKAAAFFLVLGVILVVVILAEVVLNIMQRQSRLTHHEVSRIQAYYAAEAGMNYALEMLRTGIWTAGGSVKYACINGCVDAVTPDYSITDSDIAYDVQIAINPKSSGLSQLNIKTDYTY